MIRSAIIGNEGALFTSFTVTVKLLVALNAGVPLSVTTTVITLVDGPSASVGVQLIAPVPGSIVMPEGGARRPNASVLAGRSESVAEAETSRVAGAMMGWLAGP